MPLTASDIAKYGSLTKRLNDEIHRTVQFRDSGKKKLHNEWRSAIRAWLDFKSPLEKFWTTNFAKQVRNGNKAAIEELITFLEVDPYYIFSGYLKERLLKIIKNSPRTIADDRRLRAIIWNRAAGPKRREFKHYCRLALKINTPDFTEQVHQAAKNAPNTWNKFSFLLRYLSPTSN